MNLPHPDIGLHLINDLPILIKHLIVNIIKERILRTPGFDCLERNHGHTAVGGGNLLLSHRFLWRIRISYRDLQARRTFFVERRTNNELLLVDVSVDLHVLQTVLRDGFHPHGLPDSGCTDIFTIVGAQHQGLFSGRLVHAPKVALGVHYKVMRSARGSEISDVKRE